MNTSALLIGSLLALASCAPVYAGMLIAPGTPAHTHSDASTGGGTLSLSGTLSSTKACVAGFTRMGPNYCHRTGTTASFTWADATACTARTPAGSLPADAKVVVLQLIVNVISNNAVGGRGNLIRFHDDAACTSVDYYVSVQQYEFVAITAGTIFAIQSVQVHVPLVGGTTFYATQFNAGGAGNADVADVMTVGYFD